VFLLSSFFVAATFAQAGGNITICLQGDQECCGTSDRQTCTPSIPGSLPKAQVKLGPVLNGIVPDCQSAVPSRPMCCNLNDVIAASGGIGTTYLNTEYATLGVKNSQTLFAWIPQGGSTEIPATVSLSEPVTRTRTYSFAATNFLCESARSGTSCVAGPFSADGSVTFKNLTTAAGVVVDAVVDQVGFWNQLGPTWTLAVVPRDPAFKPFFTFMSAEDTLGYSALRACHKFTDEPAGFCFAVLH
jgi:hypothetical protein